MPLKKFQCRYNAVEDKGVEFLYRYTKLGFGGHWTHFDEFWCIECACTVISFSSGRLEAFNIGKILKSRVSQVIYSLKRQKKCIKMVMMSHGVLVKNNQTPLIIIWYVSHFSITFVYTGHDQDKNMLKERARQGKTCAKMPPFPF